LRICGIVIIVMGPKLVSIWYYGYSLHVDMVILLKWHQTSNAKNKLANIDFVYEVNPSYDEVSVLA